MSCKAVFAIIGVFIGCGFDALFLEFAARVDPGCGNLITFLQFFSISVYGFFFTVKGFMIEPNIPINEYIKLVLMFFTSSWLNNYALNFNVSVPLLMIFRSGSLISNMILGIIILNKSYDVWKYFSVVIITVGIFICTIATGSDMKRSHVDNDSFFYWMIGVSMLTLALFISARMGLYQEVLYKKRGKHVAEALFYTHFLPLPFFMFMATNIFNHAIIATQSETFTIPLLNFSTPIQFIYLVVNFMSHYLCISSVYVLMSECTSLTHPFTFYHWTGTIFIIVGTVIFTEIVPKIKTRGKQIEINNEEDPLINDESQSNNCKVIK